MVVDKEELIALIVAVVKELGDQDQVELPTNITPTTPLFGESGFLDSMSLVSLVVALEQSIEDKFGKAVSLADEKALSRRNSPYRTIDTLAEYAAGELAA
jgi:D-alanine--poly(phosphoribitol) ligase subunit 2